MILHCYQIIIFYVACIVCQLTPWPLDNHKVATFLSSVRHVVSLPHGYAVNTTCMSQTFWLDFVLIIKWKFTNLRNIMVNMQAIMYVTCYICTLLHLLQPSNGWQQRDVI
jgi:hypothetical protein